MVARSAPSGRILRSSATAKGGSRTKASLASDQSERVARTAVENGDTTIATVEKALSLAVVPLSANRKNVIPKGQEAVRGAVCGLYVFAHRIGVSSYSRGRPWLTRLLTAFCRSSNPSFGFTSIQVNVDYAARPHTDKNNLGKSLIIG
ncbi:unnamed protein product, partial [Polarella glacialis]